MPPRIVAAMGMALAIAVGAAAALASAAEPTMFRGGADHRGVFAGGGRQYGGLSWRIATDGPLRGSPAVDPQGRIFFGSADGRLRAASPTGAVLWSADLGAPTSSSPALTDGLVLLQTRRDLLVAVDAASGKVAWRISAAHDAPLAWGLESGDLYQSSPVIAGGLAVIGGGDGTVRAIEPRSGRQRWSFPTGGRVRASPAIADGVVYAASFDGSLYALELATGRLKWRFDTLGHGLKSADFGFDRRSIQSSPSVADGIVYFGARDGFLWAVDALTGKERWRYDHKVFWVIGAPAVADGRVFNATSDLAVVQALDAGSGKEVWSHRLEEIAWPSPAVADGVAYFADSAGQVAAFDAGTGQPLWSQRLPAGVFGGPVPVAGGLLVPCQDGALYRIALRPERALRRVVYWDAAMAKAAWFQGHEAVRALLARHGWEIRDTKGIVEILGQADAAANTVVVFAMDVLPAPLLADAQGKPAFRRWLEAGGRAVWLDVPPNLLPKDAATGEARFELNHLDRAGVGRLLDVNLGHSNFDLWGATATPAARRLGLDGHWLGMWEVDPASVDVVLARDENGQASSWIKRYGRGSFIMLNRGHKAWPDLTPLELAAEAAANA